MHPARIKGVENQNHLKGVEMKTKNWLASALTFGMLFGAPALVAGNGVVHGTGMVEGSGVAHGKGVFKGSGVAHGTGVAIYRGKDGKVHYKKGTGTVHGHGIVIGKGTVAGHGRGMGRGCAAGHGKARRFHH